MNNPLVSILIPVYNVEAYLPKCLDTVLGQTYTNLQVVLIDDGSTDGSWNIMQEYASKDARVEIYHQENQGVSPTRNHLLEKVKGDYVLFVDSDDWIELDMVEYLVGLALKHQSGFVMCDRVMNDTPVSRDEPKVTELRQEKAVEDFLYHEYFVGSLWNKLLGSSLLHNERFHCGIWYGEDALFCWNVLQKVDKVVVTSKQLYHYRMNDESISHQSFSEKKLTGYIVWEQLYQSVKTDWPQFVDIVTVSRALQYFHLLRQAAGGYKKDDKIKELQRIVAENREMVLKSYRLSKKDAFNYIMTSIWYGYGFLYQNLYELKNKR